MLEALVTGENDTARLAAHARGKLKDKRSALEAALQGSIGAHQRFVLKQLLASIDHFDALITEVDAEIQHRLEADVDPPRDTPSDGSPCSGSQAVSRLDAIPGVGTRVAEILVAEVGRDVRRFPSAAHLASWAGLCPGHKESGGKRYSGRTRPGSPALRRALVEAARAAARTHTYLAAQFHRLAGRRGGKRAAVAVAHSILVIAYQILRDGSVYQDLGQTYFDERDRTRVTQRLIQRLRNLGLVVEVQPIAA